MAKDKKSSSGKPTPPKRALSGFFLYKADVFEQVRNENPGMKMPQITTKISEMWKEIDAKSKEKYEARHQELKAKHDEDVKEYEAKYGPIEKKSRKSKKSKKGADSDDEDESDSDSDKKKKKKGKK